MSASGPDQISVPVYSGQEKPAYRTQPARHYGPGQRARDSLTTRATKVMCALFLSLLFICGIIVFIVWLSLTPHRPRFYVQDFSIPALARSDGFENAQISFNVTIRNSNQHIHTYYDSLVATVFYRDQSIGTTPLSGPLDQEPKTTWVVFGVLGGATLNVNNARWTDFLNDRQQGTVIFRLGITSTIKFKVSTWDSKSHKAHVDCEVSVGPDGLILPSSRSKKCNVYFT
ncbi:hypothetical protein SLE2022_015230 [Rubroshorea leprosula]